MKKLKFVFICLGLTLGMGDVSATEPLVKPSQAEIQALTVEYRLRVQAQGFVLDLTLFDDMGILGRAVAMPLSLDDSKETIVSGGGGRGPESSGPSFIVTAPSAQLEMSGGVDPLLDLQLKIEGVQKELEQLKRQYSQNEKKEDLNKVVK